MNKQNISNMKKVIGRSILGVFDFFEKYLGVICVVLLVGIMPIFIYNIWFSEGDYAMPTRSVCLIGLTLVIIGAMNLSVSESRSQAHVRLMTIYFICFALAYLVVPSVARDYVNDQGRYWKTSSILGEDDWVYQLPLSIIGDPSTYPRWSFFQKAKDPVKNLWAPEYGGAKPKIASKLHKSLELSGGKLCDIYVEYEYKSSENEDLMLQMVKDPFGKEEVDTFLQKDLLPRITKVVTESAERCQMNQEVKIELGDYNPVSALAPSLNVEGSITCMFTIRPTLPKS